jgi:hypothetical protein
MRIKILIVSCFLAAACLALALRGAWAEADAADGTRYRVSLRKVSHVLEPARPDSPHEDCDYLRAKGKVQLCAPAEYGDAPFSMLCSVFTLMLAALLLALASGTVTVVSPYRAKGLGAQLAGASFIAALLGTVLAQAAMSRALAVLEGLPMQFGGLAFNSAWTAIGLLLFAAGLSTTSTMLGHH